MRRCSRRLEVYCSAFWTGRKDKDIVFYIGLTYLYMDLNSPYNIQSLSDICSPYSVIERQLEASHLDKNQFSSCRFSNNMELSRIIWMVRREIIIVHQIFWASLVDSQTFEASEDCAQSDVEFTICKTLSDTRVNEIPTLRAENGDIRHPNTLPRAFSKRNEMLVKRPRSYRVNPSLGIKPVR
jgi:hypothetical protein